MANSSSGGGHHHLVRLLARRVFLKVLVIRRDPLLRVRLSLRLVVNMDG